MKNRYTYIALPPSGKIRSQSSVSHLHSHCLAANGSHKNCNTMFTLRTTNHLQKWLLPFIDNGKSAHSLSTPIDRLEFAYRPQVGVEDVIIYQLHWGLSQVDKAGSCCLTSPVLLLQFTLFYWKRSFLRFIDPSTTSCMDVCLSSWSTAKRAPLGTVLSSFFFSLYASYFLTTLESCHLQNVSHRKYYGLGL